MVNINLSTGSSFSRKERLPYKKGIIIILASLLFLGGVYVGMIFYQKGLFRQTQYLNDSYANEHAKLVGESNKKVIDFQNRLTAAKKIAVQPATAKETLLEMEKSIASGVYISSYNLDAEKNSLLLLCVTDNFNMVAQQISIFKKSDYFSSVALGEAKVNKDGKIEFKIELKIK